MKEFKFYQDVLLSMWQRQYFTIEAESKEEAFEKAKEYSTVDVSRDLLLDNTDYLFETECLVDTEANDGRSTIEVYDSETNEIIGCNGNINITKGD